MSAIGAALRVALSGGLTGAAFGAGGKLLSGAKTWPEILRAALAAGAGGAGIAGASQLVGNMVSGEPQEGEEGSPATTRGGVGGGILGALGGGAAGALLASGRAPMLAKKLEGMSPLIAKKMAQFAAEPHAIAKGAGLGAMAAGIPAAYFGANEGMGYDAIMAEIEEEQKKRQMLEAMQHGGNY
jgi:hypothetical protein